MWACNRVGLLLLYLHNDIIANLSFVERISLAAYVYVQVRVPLGWKIFAIHDSRTVPTHTIPYQQFGPYISHC